MIDRYIAGRFLTNFVILFALLYLFGTAIDLILNLDPFVDETRRRVGEDAGLLERCLMFVRLTVDFEGPRLFQFYAYLHGLVALGAMGFTLAHMHRNMELVAMLASGVSLHRLAMPFIGVVFGLSMVQLLNQELVLPRVAPLLLRSHTHIGHQSVHKFKVPFTADGHGNLLQSPSFDPQTQALERPTILKRDERGRAVERITAEVARWDDGDEPSWRLVGGKAVRLPAPEELGPLRRLLEQPVEYYQTDLTPEALTVRRYGQFATMLSLTQIKRMMASPQVVDVNALMRYRASRFAGVLVNLLVLVITLPFFLLREPASLLRQSVWCAATALPAMLGAFLGMAVELPGIPPTVGAFLPAIVLVPIALTRAVYVKT
ncbi:MAG: LptF/LptG family permease [Planctomycetota bacterium]|jgi:lipopolysaccharide export LptBFGC system permease protein LptF